MDIVFFLCLLTIGQGIFLSIYLLTSKPKKKASSLLSAIVLIESLALYDEVFLFFQNGNLPIALFYIGSPLFAAIGPLVLGYIHFRIYPKSSFKWIYLLHFIPVIAVIVFSLYNYHLKPYSYKTEYIAFFQNRLHTNPIDKPIFERIINNSFRAYITCYLIISWIYLTRSKTIIRSKVNEGFIKILLIGLIIISSSSLVLEYTTLPADFSLRFIILLIVFASHIFGLAYLYFLPPKVLVNADKYQKSGLKDGAEQKIKNKLEELMVNEKIYLNKLLTIKKLANLANTNVHYLSQVINSQYHMSYNGLINSYRIEEAKRLLSQETPAISITDIATQSGFASNATFFRKFKQHTEMTPQQYKKSKAM